MYYIVIKLGWEAISGRNYKHCLELSHRDFELYCNAKEAREQGKRENSLLSWCFVSLMYSSVLVSHSVCHPQKVFLNLLEFFAFVLHFVQYNCACVGTKGHWTKSSTLHVCTAYECWRTGKSHDYRHVIVFGKLSFRDGLVRFRISPAQCVQCALIDHWYPLYSRVREALWEYSVLPEGHCTMTPDRSIRTNYEGTAQE